VGRETVARLGMNVDTAGWADASQIAAAGARWVRIVAAQQDHKGGPIDQRPFLQACKDSRLKVLLVIASESLHPGNWGQEADRYIGWYADRYSGLFDAVQVGNEPDGSEGASWIMTPDDLNWLLMVARTILPDAFLVGPGLSSGQPNWMHLIDTTKLNAVAAHPYGKIMRGWEPSVPGWGTGYVDQFIKDYKDVINQINPGLEFWITEYGAPAAELGRAVPTGGNPGGQGEYVWEVTAHLKGASAVDKAFHFSWFDFQNPAWRPGLLDEHGNAKPALEAFTLAARG
jgi:hypothetical protein